MGTIITTATIMAIYLNAVSGANPQYCYNADMDNGKVVSMYVYDKQGKSLGGKLEYRYAYDAEGRLASKDVLAADRLTGRMEPCCRYDYVYKDGGYSVSRSKWNARLQAFAAADSRTDYLPAGSGLVAVSTYELADDGSTYALVESLLAFEPVGGGVLAAF